MTQSVLLVTSPRIYLRNPKFELLFESGANALLDGYLLQSVASFAAALEQFQVFYIRAVCEKWSSPNEMVLKALNQHVNRAERQLGAYVTLFLIENGSVPKLLPEDPTVKLRNKIIHRGYFPSEDEATNYGQAVLELLEAGYRQLLEKYQSELATLDRDSLRSQIGPLNAVNHAGEPVTYTMLTILRTCLEYPNIPVDLKKGLVALRARRSD